jgi:transposase
MILATMFVREVVTGQKSGDPVRYAQVVHSYRDSESGKVKHRVLLSLGRVDRLDKEQIQRFITSLSRYLETDEVPAGGRVGEVRDYGVPYLADALWRRLVLPELLARQLRKRKFEIAVERALFAMVAHRLVDPGSKRSCAEWLENDAYLPGARGLTVHQLYRAMDFLDEAYEDLEVALFQHRRTLFDRASIVYFDTTSTYFEVDDGRQDDVAYGLRQRGYSRDEKPDRRQIVVGLATDQNGLPIISDVFSGDTNDALTVVPMLERVRRLGLTNIVWVTDRGMASEDNLSAVRAAGLDIIVGIKLRAHDTLRDLITSDPTPYQKASDGLLAKDVRHGDKRYVVCFSPESAERDLALRLGAIERLKTVCARVNAGADACEISRNGWYSRLASKDADGRWVLDKGKLDREAQCDGVFVLEVSRTTMSASEAALAYKGLLRVERCFHALKHTVDIRPVYHRLDRRIRAHVTLCMLALLLERVMERETKESFATLRTLFMRVRAVELILEGQSIWETSKLPPETKKILSTLRLDVPPRVLPSAP